MGEGGGHMHPGPELYQNVMEGQQNTGRGDMDKTGFGVGDSGFEAGPVRK